MEQRITTDEAELANVAVEVGIEKTAFLNAYHRDEVKQALQNDFNLRATLGVRGLPAYLFCYGDKHILRTGVLNFADFTQTIQQISNGTILPTPPELNEALLQHFIQKRPLVSLTEIRHAFHLASNQAVMTWLNKIPHLWQPHGKDFLERVMD